MLTRCFYVCVCTVALKNVKKKLNSRDSEYKVPRLLRSVSSFLLLEGEDGNTDWNSNDHNLILMNPPPLGLAD